MARTFFLSPGVNDLTAKMPELAPRSNVLDIDAVFTWIDGLDPNWIAAFKAVDSSKASQDAKAGARFHDNDELRYALSSLQIPIMLHTRGAA